MPAGDDHTSNPVNIFSEIDRTVDQWHTKTTMKHPLSLNPPPAVDLDIQCTTNAAAASYTSLQQNDQHQHQKYSVFLLGLNFSFAPSSNVDAYMIGLRVLKDASLTTKGPDTVSAATKLSLQDSKQPFDLRFAKENQNLLPGSEWPSTAPTNVENATSYSTSSSYTLGTDVGFFGETPTGGLHTGATISYSTTVNVTPVQVINHSDSDGLDIRFVLQTDGGKKGTFQPRVQSILRVEDDGLGVRDIDPDAKDSPREISLELTIRAFPSGHRFNEPELVGMHFSWQDRYYVTYHTFKRVFKVRMPRVRASLH